MVAGVLATQPTKHWLDILEPAGLWCAPVLDWRAFAASPGFAALDPVQVIRTEGGADAKTTRCPIRIDGRMLRNPVAAPALGADTDAVFGSLVAAARA